MSVHDAKVVGTEDLDPKDAKWIKLVLTRYTDPTNTPRTWESAVRTTRPSTSTTDSVGIVAIFQRPNQPATLLLQKQFRPALGRVCIEVPAGLVDSNETPLEAAARELLEETGYTGTVVSGGGAGGGGDDDFGVSGVWYSEPGLTDASTVMVHVLVDLEREENKGVVEGKGVEGEFVENFEVEVGALWGVLRALEGEGYAIDARVGGLAEGWEMARRFGGVVGAGVGSGG